MRLNQILERQSQEDQDFKIKIKISLNIQGDSVEWGRSPVAEHVQTLIWSLILHQRETNQQSQSPLSLLLKQSCDILLHYILIFKIIVISSLKVLYNVFWSYSSLPQLLPDLSPLVYPHRFVSKIVLCLSIPLFIEYIFNINGLLMIFTIFQIFYLYNSIFCLQLKP